MKKIVILISGRGSNMEAILKNSLEEGGVLHGICKPVAVVSNREDAAGLKTAANYRIDTVVVPSKGKSRQKFEEELTGVIERCKPDYVVLAGFMRIFTPFFVGKYRGRIINIHPADTKEYRGMHGYEWAFEKGKKETLITVHYVDEDVDAGKIIDTCKVDLSGAKTLDEVKKIGLKAEREFYSRVLRNVLTQTRNSKLEGNSNFKIKNFKF